MSPLVTWLVLALLNATSAQNATTDQTPNLDQNPSDEPPHHDTIETATIIPGNEHELHQQIPNENRNEKHHLNFNPPDLIPFPKQGQVAQFWLDHPDFKAIPDLPAKDTEYPKWLLKVMGRIPPTTPASNPTEDDRVLLPPDGRTFQQPEVRPMDRRTPESESESLIPEVLPRRNDMESRFEINNIPVQQENANTEFFLPPEIPIQESLLNSRMQHLRPAPNNIQRQTVGTVIPDFYPNQNGPIHFRAPLNVGPGRIQNIKSSNTRRNPNNFVIMRDNRFENRQFSTAPVQMLPLQRQNFRGIPVTLSRPSMVHQLGILMLPMRNQNVPSRFSPTNFILSHPPRVSPTREWLTLGPKQNRQQNPSFARQNEILVDPRFSRESWSSGPVQNENFQRKPKLTNRRQDFVESEKQANTLQNGMIQPNGSSSFSRRSGIGARNKRQSGFESFDPFGMGNIFSFFPSEKEPQNTFNWFPQESMMNSPTQQSPVSSGVFNPNANRRPAKPSPKQQITYPQDPWMVLPPSSRNTVPNFQGQNPQTNHGSSNKQLPEDFMIIRPNKASQRRGSSNKMPWMLSSLFGGDLFPENGGNQMWTFQSPFDDHSRSNNKQAPRFSNNVPNRPLQGGRVTPSNNHQFQVQPPVTQPFQNFHPSRGQTQHLPLDNNIQRPSNHLSPSVNRNTINRGHIQDTSHSGQTGTHVQPQENWRPAHQRPVQPQPSTVPQSQNNWKPAPQRPSLPQLPAVPHGAWIPKDSVPKKVPVSRTNHFHEMPSPNHQQPHHRHHEEQSTKLTEVPANQKDRRQPHRKPIQPEIQKGKRKLSPSEVQHLLSLLPEFPKEVHKKPGHGNPKSQTVGLTIKATSNRQKRSVHDPILGSADTDDGKLTQNYPGSNRMHGASLTKHSNSSKFPISSRKLQSLKDRRKRDVEESLIQDVAFGSYGYHSGYDYQDGSYSDFPGSFWGFMGSNDHDSDLWGDVWEYMFPKKGHNLFKGVLDWPNHGYYRPHLGSGHFPPGHATGHYHPHHHHDDHWNGNMWPLDQGSLPGGRRVAAIPPAVPRANPKQLSYTARFRYRFGIYPGYSDYIPGTNDHEIFFFYDAKQGDRTPDAVIPFRSYYH